MDDNWLVKPSPVVKRLTSCLCVRRGALIEELVDAVSAHEGVLNLGTEILSDGIQLEDDDVVLTVSQNDVQKKIRTKLLIACDGINSVARKNIYPDVEKKWSGY